MSSFHFVDATINFCYVSYCCTSKSNSIQRKLYSSTEIGIDIGDEVVVVKINTLTHFRQALVPDFSNLVNELCWSSQTKRSIYLPSPFILPAIICFNDISSRGCRSLGVNDGGDGEAIVDVGVCTVSTFREVNVRDTTELVISSFHTWYYISSLSWVFHPPNP